MVLWKRVSSRALHMSNICDQFVCRTNNVIIGAALMCLSASTLAPVCHAQQPDKKQLSRWLERINSLATTNPEPELVNLRPGSTQVEPLFSQEFDWGEYKRVVSVFYSLGLYGGSDLWEELIKHLDDKRYALTMGFNGSKAHNYTVGQLCSLIASPRIFFPERWRSNSDSRGRPDIRLDLGIEDLADWRKERKEKPLYALQIEVCERALEQIDLNERVTEISKAEIRRELESRIKQLKKDRRPHFSRLSTDGYDFYSAERAKTARERIDKLKPN